MQNDSTVKTIVVAALLCVVCSVLVSTAAVKLKPLQAQNAKLDIQRKLLLTSGLIDNPKASKTEVAEAFKSVEAKVIDLETGEVATDIRPEEFDQAKAAKNPETSTRIPPSKDLAKIKRRSRYAKVYLIIKGGELDQIVLPVHGKGLWSTMYGFLALDEDTKTVRGFGFYSHGETPGLGGEVDNPRWKKQWEGKKIYDSYWNPVIDVIKGSVDESSAQAAHQIDGLSGATITSSGVEALVQYWSGDHGFGTFLSKVRKGGVL